MLCDLGLIELLCRHESLFGEGAKPLDGARGKLAIGAGASGLIRRDGRVRPLGREHAPAGVELSPGEFQIGLGLRDREAIGQRIDLKEEVAFGDADCSPRRQFG